MRAIECCLTVSIHDEERTGMATELGRPGAIAADPGLEKNIFFSSLVGEQSRLAHTRRHTLVRPNVHPQLPAQTRILPCFCFVDYFSNRYFCLFVLVRKSK